MVDVRDDGELRQGTTGSDIRKFGRKEIEKPRNVTSFDPPNRMVIQYEQPSDDGGILVPRKRRRHPRYLRHAPQTQRFWRLLDLPGERNESRTEERRR